MEVDSIPGRLGKNATSQERLEANKKTWENFLYMYGKVKSPQKLVPVFHAGSNTMYLENILNFEPKVDLVAIGNIVGKTKAEKVAKLHKIFEIIKHSKNPDIKVHALGVQDFDLIAQFPLYSADASSWIMQSANGGVMSDFGAILLSDKSTNKKQHFVNQSLPVQKAITSYVNKFGYTIEELSEDYKKRTLFNIKYLEQKAKDNVCTYGTKPKQNTLF